jgi:hypothetical protein
MKKPTIEKIHKVMRKHKMTVFTKPFDVTLGGIRTKDNVANTFNDWLFASYWDDKKVLQHVIVPGTTDAGLTARLKPTNAKGVVIIQHGIQHRGVYRLENPKVVPTERGHKGKEAFRQIKPMKYWRDNDRDNILETGSNEEFTLSFTNGHDMGTKGFQVNNWSEGCWGSTEKNMQLLYNIGWLQFNNGLGRVFSFALLYENMF